MTVFCTPQDVRPHTRASQNWTQLDPTIISLIETVSQQIRTFCRRQFDKAAYIQYFPVPDMRYNSDVYTVRLKEWPVDLDEDFIADYDYTGQFYTTAPLNVTEHYVVNADQGSVAFNFIFSGASRALRLRYTGGYSVAPSLPDVLQVPANIKAACAMQVAFLLSRNEGLSIGKVEEQREKNSRTVWEKTRPSGLLAEVETMLIPYRRLLVGGA